MKVWIGKILKAYLYKEDVYKEEVKGLRCEQSPQVFVMSIQPDSRLRSPCYQPKYFKFLFCQSGCFGRLDQEASTLKL